MVSSECRGLWAFASPGLPFPMAEKYFATSLVLYYYSLYTISLFDTETGRDSSNPVKLQMDKKVECKVRATSRTVVQAW